MNDERAKEYNYSETELNKIREFSKVVQETLRNEHQKLEELTALNVKLTELEKARYQELQQVKQEKKQMEMLFAEEIKKLHLLLEQKESEKNQLQSGMASMTEMLTQKQTENPAKSLQAILDGPLDMQRTMIVSELGVLTNSLESIERSVTDLFTSLYESLGGNVSPQSAVSGMDASKREENPLDAIDAILSGLKGSSAAPAQTVPFASTVASPAPTEFGADALSSFSMPAQPQADPFADFTANKHESFLEYPAPAVAEPFAAFTTPPQTPPAFPFQPASQPQPSFSSAFAESAAQPDQEPASKSSDLGASLSKFLELKRMQEERMKNISSLNE